MKKLLICVALLSLFSCKKDNSPGQMASTLKFKGNGILYEWNGVESDTSSVGSALHRDTVNYLHSLGAYDFRSNGYNKMSFDVMHGGDLRNGTFTYRSTNSQALIGECTIGTVGGSVLYWNSAQDDSISVTITGVESGFVSGSFKGSITRDGGSEKLVITDGLFQHVKIIND